MPVVLLRSRSTGAQLYVVNVHNPSDMYGSLGHQRDDALRIESRVVDQLLTTGSPLVFTGDFNARDDPVCTLTPRLTNAFGSNGARCGATRGESIDHIFGAGVAFTDARTDGTPVRQRISDHDLVMTTVTTAP
jgi:endonuclease/exonuclease/phosphatase (EEP) superfamily protein YafD